MPEGDTVHKVARALRPGLEGQRLAGLWLRDRGWVAPLAGSVVREIAPLGKHFLIHLDAGADARIREWVLHVHLGMHGRWLAGAPGARTGPSEMVRLETGERGFVCTGAARAELLPRGQMPFHPALARLGPDLLGARVDLTEIVRRARRAEPRSVAELLLNQRVACGIGNEYKSEVLFLEGVHPRTPVAALPDAVLERVYRRARRLLGRNLGGGRRTTVPTTGRAAPRDPRARLWVYGRSGRPCRACGTSIRHAHLGDDARPTYWCPHCQPEPGPAPPAADASPRSL